jgi:hypothetical protein
MAAPDGSDLDNLDRPRRIAARLVERFGLAPPVDIRALLRHYAEVEVVTSIPADCDALVIGLNLPSVARPKVIVNDDRPRRRKRFSMAHELGHILIPGHISIELCFMEDGFYSSSDHERQAHSFASEILMPTRWLSDIVSESEHAGEVFSAAGVANVSAAAAMLSINRLLAPGTVIALMQGHMVEMALGSPGTVANVPYNGQTLDPRSIDSMASASGAVTFGGRKISWWSFDTEVGLGQEDEGDERTASEVLRAIADEVFASNAEGRQHALASINAVAGLAKDVLGPAASAEEMLGRLRARLAGRDKHMMMMSHPLFETYLRKKARDLYQRQ